MNTVVDFPVIDPPPPAAGVPATLKASVLAQFCAVETDLLALAERYRAVAYDVQTGKGLAAAKAARHELRERGRFLVQRAETKIKTEVNDLKKTVADEVERLVAIVRPVEDAIDAQIKAREDQIAAEKAEAERKAAEAARLEAERRQRHEAGLATLAGYAQRARGKTAAQMATGIAVVEQIQVDPEHWQEYAERAAATLSATLATLRDMHAAQAKAEDEAAELERQRREQAAENARLRALAEQQAAELAQLRAAQQAEDARVTALAEQRRQDAAAESARIAAQAAAAPQVVPHAALVQPAAVLSDKPTADDNARAFVDSIQEPATLKLGVICERLGITMTAAFLADTLRIQPARTDKTSKLYTEQQYALICRQLIAHVGAMAELYATAEVAA